MKYLLEQVDVLLPVYIYNPFFFFLFFFLKKISHFLKLRCQQTPMEKKFYQKKEKETKKI